MKRHKRCAANPKHAYVETHAAFSRCGGKCMCSFGGGKAGEGEKTCACIIGGDGNW